MPAPAKDYRGKLTDMRRYDKMLKDVHSPLPITVGAGSASGSMAIWLLRLSVDAERYDYPFVCPSHIQPGNVEKSCQLSQKLRPACLRRAFFAEVATKVESGYAQASELF